METSVDARRWLRPGHPGRWLVVAAVVVVAVAAALLLRGLASSGTAGAEPRSLPDQLTDRVVRLLEESTRDEHAAHGHHVDDDAEALACVAETFGFDPPDAATLDEVEVVYARHMCAVVGAGFTWPQAVRASGPIVVELTEEPATVRLPAAALPGDEDADYADRIRALVPDAYHDEALDPEFTDQTTTTDVLRKRVEDAT